VVLGVALFRRWVSRLGIPAFIPTGRPARQPAARP
jgi:hypothetical protein